MESSDEDVCRVGYWRQPHVVRIRIDGLDTSQSCQSLGESSKWYDDRAREEIDAPRTLSAKVGDGLPTGTKNSPWIPERSATRLREADLNVLSKLGNQGLERRLEPEAFTGGEVGREDDLLDVLVGCPIDIQVARQPST